MKLYLSDDRNGNRYYLRFNGRELVDKGSVNDEGRLESGAIDAIFLTGLNHEDADTVEPYEVDWSDFDTSPGVVIGTFLIQDIKSNIPAAMAPLNLWPRWLKLIPTKRDFYIYAGEQTEELAQLVVDNGGRAFMLPTPELSQFWTEYKGQDEKRLREAAGKLALLNREKERLAASRANQLDGDEDIVAPDSILSAATDLANKYYNPLRPAVIGLTVGYSGLHGHTTHYLENDGEITIPYLGGAIYAPCAGGKTPILNVIRDAYKPLQKIENDDYEKRRILAPICKDELARAQREYKTNRDFDALKAANDELAYTMAKPHQFIVGFKSGTSFGSAVVDNAISAHERKSQPKGTLLLYDEATRVLHKPTPLTEDTFSNCSLILDGQARNDAYSQQDKQAGITKPIVCNGGAAQLFTIQTERALIWDYEDKVKQGLLQRLFHTALPETTSQNVDYIVDYRRYNDLFVNMPPTVFHLNEAAKMEYKNIQAGLQARLRAADKFEKSFIAKNSQNLLRVVLNFHMIIETEEGRAANPNPEIGLDTFNMALAFTNTTLDETFKAIRIIKSEKTEITLANTLSPTAARILGWLDAFGGWATRSDITKKKAGNVSSVSSVRADYEDGKDVNLERWKAATDELIDAGFIIMGTAEQKNKYHIVRGDYVEATKQEG